MNENEAWVWIVAIIAVSLAVVCIVNAICGALKSKYECQRPVAEENDDSDDCCRFSYGWALGAYLEYGVDYLAEVFQKRVIIIFYKVDKPSNLRDELEACDFELTSWGFRDLLQEIDEKIELITSLELGEGDSEALRERSLNLLEWFKQEVELFVACDMADKEQDEY